MSTKNIKHIYFIIGDISRCGGTEKMALFLASNLCEHGYKVSILSINGNGIPFFSHNQNIKFDVLYPRRKSGYITFLCKRRLKKYLMEHTVDLIIDVDIILTLITTYAIEGTDIKHISWDHFNYEYNLSIASRKKSIIKNVNNADAIVVLTKNDFNYYINKFPNSNFVHIWNPLEINRRDYLYNMSSKTIVSIGRFSHQKGFDLLLNAWKLVEQKNDDWYLEIWGSSKHDDSKILKTFNKLKLKRAYLRKQTKEIDKVLSNASFFVLSSRFEGYPLSLLEACASSLPIVAFNCSGGVDEIVDNNINGILVEPYNIQLLASAMLTLIKNENKRIRMSKESYRKCNLFDKNIIIHQWLELINAL